MLTNNWYRAVSAILYTTSATIPVTRTNGNTAKLYPSSSLCKLPTLMKSLTKGVSATVSGVVLGTGSTPVVVDDITLSGEEITTFTYTSNVATKVTDDGVELTATYTITNTGADDFTVSEIGLFQSMYTASSSATGTMMLDRTVLDEPLTIQAGGIGLVTYTIRLNYPT